MKKIEGWKVRRELWRLREQIGRRLSAIFYDPPRQFLYDRKIGRNLALHEGTLPLSTRVAVVVLFQPKGLAASTLFTLDHLAQAGWSVLAISNAPLGQADLDAVRARSAAVIERPNVGYDFGAYREGIRHLERIGHQPEKLILMNDSTWFPLHDGDTTLQRMEALNVDLAGHIYKIEDTEKRGRDHLESHLLLFSGGFLDHPEFARFWRQYLMSDDRANTIARGEKSITQTALAAGLKVEGLLSRDNFVDLLKTLTDAELADIVRQTVFHREDARQYCEALLADAEAGKPWRQRYLDWVYEVLSNSRQHLLSATFVEPAIRMGGMGFVKKANDRRHQLGRMAVIRAEDAGRIPALHPVVRAEIEEAIRSWEPPFDWRARPDDPKEAVL